MSFPAGFDLTARRSSVLHTLHFSSAATSEHVFDLWQWVGRLCMCVCVCWVKAGAVWPKRRGLLPSCLAVNVRNTDRNVAAVSHPSECSLISGIMNQSLLYGSHIEQICLKVISLFYARTAFRMLACTHFTGYKYKCHLDCGLSLITLCLFFYSCLGSDVYGLKATKHRTHWSVWLNDVAWT